MTGDRRTSERRPSGLSAQSKYRFLVHWIGLATAGTVSYWLTSHILAHVSFVANSDHFIGGMWATLACVFVYHNSERQDLKAALGRMVAAAVSLSLCLVYLLLFRFNPIGLGIVIAVGAAIISMLGRHEDVVITGISTTVVMVVAVMGPPDKGWEQPILNLFDTVVGVVVALVVAWLAGLVMKLGPKRGPTYYQ